MTLDKIRPIDQKLKYQVEKLVKIAIKGARNENDPCRFKANPGNMTNEVVLLLILLFSIKSRQYWHSKFFFIVHKASG